MGVKMCTDKMAHFMRTGDCPRLASRPARQHGICASSSTELPSARVYLGILPVDGDTCRSTKVPSLRRRLRELREREGVRKLEL